MNWTHSRLPPPSRWRFTTHLFSARTPSPNMGLIAEIIKPRKKGREGNLHLDDVIVWKWRRWEGEQRNYHSKKFHLLLMRWQRTWGGRWTGFMYFCFFSFAPFCIFRSSPSLILPLHQTTWQERGNNKDGYHITVGFFFLSSSRRLSSWHTHDAQGALMNHDLIILIMFWCVFLKASTLPSPTYFNIKLSVCWSCRDNH